jgi:hypothetical protein
MSTTNKLPDAPAVKRGGPTTPEGQEIVKRNALVHGFSDRRVVIACLGEREEDYRALLDALLDEHSPEEVTEQLLVNEMATNRWRHARALPVENAEIERQFINYERAEKDALRPADAALKEATGRFEGAKRVLEILRSAEHEGAISWEVIPEALWEDVLADFEPRMVSLPARELGQVRTPEEVIAILRRELSLDDAKLSAELLRVAGKNVASAQEEIEESLESREEIVRDYALQKATASLPSEIVWAKIHRHTTSLDKEFRQKLEMLIKLKEIRRDRQGALVRELPPPDDVGRGAEDVPEVQG